jgi:hypothetical protein
VDGYLKQSTAAQVRTIGPFVDDTDFKTLENALTIANTDILIKKNGAASAAKNSGGATADGAGGLYAVTWDATDTATVGQVSYSVKVAGSLVVFGSYIVVEEAIYDAIFAASANAWTGAAGSTTLTALADSSITAAKIASDAITAAKIATGAIDADALAADAGTEIGTAVWATAARTLTAATNITSTGGTTIPQTGDSFARLGVPAGASVSADIAVINAAMGGIAQTGDAYAIVASPTFGNAALKTIADNIPTNAELATAITAGVAGTPAAVLAAATAAPIAANIEQINTVPIVGDGSGTPFNV